MTYAYIDDGFPEHPKVARAGGAAAWLWVCGLCYSQRNLTGGRIPKAVIPQLSDAKRPGDLAARLVEVGLWEDDGDDFYRIHDYAEWNFSAERKRERATAKAKKAAAARWGKDPPEDIETDAQAMLMHDPEHAPCNAHAMHKQCITMPPARERARTPTPQLPNSHVHQSPETEVLVKTSFLAPTALKRSRDPLWDATMAACGIDGSELTESSRGAYARAVADLRRAKAEPDEVTRRAGVFTRRWPDASLTPTALARRWPECTTAPTPAPKPDPYAATAAAARAIAERNDARLRGEVACESCADSGWLEGDNGTAIRCRECVAVAT